MTQEEFIEKYRTHDVRMLALQGGKYPELDMPYILDQIRGWQIARTKLPLWAEKTNIIYPPHISMEQCSSEQTALYKDKIAVRLCGEERRKMVDLTGGFGVDFSYIAREFEEATYIERLPHLCEIAAKNLCTLGLQQAEVVCADGTEYLKKLNGADLIYLDPARRDNNGGRTYALEDCTPNVMELKTLLLDKAKNVMVKLSPMLDWHKVVEDLGCVTEVHIISTRNECKELLVVMSRNATGDVRVFCNNDSDTISFSTREIQDSTGQIAEKAVSPTDKILLEPNSSLMKAGCFNLLSDKYDVKKIALYSNLFVSDTEIEFPGRKFKIESVTTMNKKELKRTLSGITKANVSVRNFPLTAEQLKLKLKLKDGGEHYIFGTTDSDGQHVILVCRKYK